MNAQVAQHLNIAQELIKSVEEWANVLFVRFFKGRPRFVSKKICIKMSNKNQNGLILRKFSDPMLFTKVFFKLQTEFAETFKNAGLNDSQINELINNLIKKARAAMNDEYVVMSGAREDEILFNKCRSILFELNEQGRAGILLADDNAQKHQEIISDPSESDLEDIYNVIDSLNFEGSPKQIKWARDIAIKNSENIHLAGVTISKIPTSAKWWIDNRGNIYEALKSSLKDSI